MSDSQSLRSALMLEQKKVFAMRVRIAELAATLAAKDAEIINVTTSATVIIRQLRLQIERLENDLASRN